MAKTYLQEKWEYYKKRFSTQLGWADIIVLNIIWILYIVDYIVLVRDYLIQSINLPWIFPQVFTALLLVVPVAILSYSISFIIVFVYNNIIKLIKRIK